jgi:Domain of unknown function (DUF222)/HNH endonuclease
MGHTGDNAAWAVPGVTANGSRLSISDLAPAVAAAHAEFAAACEGQRPAVQVVEMRRFLDRCEGLWLSAVSELDEAGFIADSGFTSASSWLRHLCRMTPSEASGRAKAAEATRELGASAEAMLEGDVTWRHILVIARAIEQVPVEHRDEAEQSLLEHARSLDPGELRRVADRLVHCFDREKADELAVRRLERRGLSVAETTDGMVSISGLLDPVAGSLLMTALDAQLRPGGSHDHGDGHSGEGETVGRAASQDEVRTWAQRRADALAEICQQWLQDVNQSSVGGVRPHLSVLVDHATLAAQPADDVVGIEPAQLSWVGPITATEAQLIGCDATVSRIITDGASQILDVGRATRTIPPALRRAVAARDRTCVGPGCHRPPEHCDVHHIVFWEHGGETSLDNTVLLCRRHHGMVHLRQWRVVIEATGRRTLQPPN